MAKRAMRAGVAVLLLLAGCGGKTKTVTQTVTSATTPTVQTQATAPAQTTPAVTSPAVGPDQALRGLLERVMRDTGYQASGAYKSGEFVTDRFIGRVEALKRQAKAQGAPGLEADPFLCAQNLPRRITYDAPRVAGDTATVVTHQDYGGGSPTTKTYGMRLVGGAWKLDSDECVR
jgi:hypothetical protein